MLPRKSETARTGAPLIARTWQAAVIGPRLAPENRMLPLLPFVVLAGAAATPDPEAARVQRHLATVEVELRAADVELSLGQHAGRAVAIDRLHRYRVAGVFPHNHRLEVRAPAFIDEHGTRCAMAHLIEEGGGAELVAAVHATRNHAYVRELADEPALIAWLDRNGLSVAEAGRIQPSYDPCWDVDCENLVEPSFLFASIGTVALDGVMIGLNLRDDASTGTAAVGLVAGGVTMLLGYSATDEEERELQHDLGWVDIGIGAVTAAVSLRSLLRERPRAAAPAPAPGPPGWSLAPVIGETSGVALRGHF